MWWLKNCCSFSLQKLMQICSNVLNSKICKEVINGKQLETFLTGLKTSNVEDADEVDLLHCWVLQESDENVQDEDITHNEGSIAEIDKP